MKERSHSNVKFVTLVLHEKNMFLYYMEEKSYSNVNTTILILLRFCFRIYDSKQNLLFGAALFLNMIREKELLNQIYYVTKKGRVFPFCEKWLIKKSQKRKKLLSILPFTAALVWLCYKCITV